MNRAATFLAVGKAPTMEPLFALGAWEDVFPRPSAWRKLESNLFTVSTLWR